ncbi:unnamed protein product [Didymodactylos carnosus]|nr:unnamed protein product [Didymodactylos carnosus]CAF4260573.1 unnamed protein product [Didymodactylos carnosus]
MSPEYKCDTFYYENVKQKEIPKRMQHLLDEIRRRTSKRKLDNDHFSYLNWSVEIHSHNTFPSSSGLASSASAYSSIAIGLSTLFEDTEDGTITPTCSYLARIGSGSAIRSLYGGFVQWYHKDPALSECMYPAEQWPELRIVILVFNSKTKPISSTDAMKRTTQTSSLYKERLKTIDEKIEQLNLAIKKRDFENFSNIVMRDSNQFHAVCMDTYPPVMYLNDQSKHFIQLVHEYNNASKITKVAYTFDAGPNPFCFILQQHLDEFLDLIKYFYPAQTQHRFHDQIKTMKLNRIPTMCAETVNNIDNIIKNIKQPIQSGKLEQVILTKIGTGPKIVVQKTDDTLATSSL